MDFSNKALYILSFERMIAHGHIFHQMSNQSQFGSQPRYRSFRGFLAIRWGRSRRLDEIRLCILHFYHKSCLDMDRYIRVRHKLLRMDNHGLLDTRLKEKTDWKFVILATGYYIIETSNKHEEIRLELLTLETLSRWNASPSFRTSTYRSMSWSFTNGSLSTKIWKLTWVSAAVLNTCLVVGTFSIVVTFTFFH